MAVNTHSLKRPEKERTCSRFSVSCLREEERDSRVSRISPLSWDDGVSLRD